MSVDARMILEMITILMMLCEQSTLRPNYFSPLFNRFLLNLSESTQFAFALMFGDGNTLVQVPAQGIRDFKTSRTFHLRLNSRSG